jgi:hypothetical protein
MLSLSDIAVDVWDLTSGVRTRILLNRFRGRSDTTLFWDVEDRVERLAYRPSLMSEK